MRFPAMQGESGGPRDMIRRVAGLGLTVVPLLLVGACATLPRHVDRPLSSAIAGTQETTLGRLIAPAARKHPAKSGFLLYNTGEGAIQARVALADVAESSIDAQ